MEKQKLKYYLIKEDSEEQNSNSYSISVPSLFKIDSGTLQALRDVQFSLTGEIGNHLTFYLVATSMSAHDLIVYIREHPDWEPGSSVMEDTGILTRKVYRYVIDPQNPAQDGLKMVYYRKIGDRVYDKHEVLPDRNEDRNEDRNGEDRNGEDRNGDEDPKEYYICLPSITLDGI